MNCMYFSFSLFCDIENHLSQRKSLQSLIDCFPKAVGHNDSLSDDDAIFVLIQSCNLKMVERLIGFFPSDSPIQPLLNKRMQELRRKDEGSLERAVKQATSSKQTFYQYLVELMNQKGFHSDAEFYHHIGISRQAFAKYRKKNPVITRDRALLMAVGLGLNYPQAEDFLQVAGGYCFRSENTREAIISYIMRNESYDLQKMDMILYSFGEELLYEYGIDDDNED